MNVAGAVNCKELLVGREVLCDTLYCNNAEIGDTLICKGPIDVQGNISVDRSIICYDEVYVGGSIICKSIIADSFDTSNNTSNALFININSGESSGSSGEIKDEAESENDLLKVLDSPLSDIYNADSQLAVSMETLATIVERLNEKIETNIGPEEMKLLTAFGGFLPEYEQLVYTLQDSLIALHNQDYSPEKWFSDFNACAKAYLSLPRWAKHIKLANLLREKLQKLINLYLSGSYVTMSKTEWTRTVGHFQQLIDIDDATITDKKKEIRDKLFGNLGLKPIGIMVKLPKE